MSFDLNRTFIAIDYGRRRIGLAKSDPTGLIASALKTLEVTSDRQALKLIGEVIDKYNPDGLVMGYPLHESGDKTDACTHIDTFIAQLQKIFEGPIHKFDERYSSLEAHEIIHAHGKKIGTDKGRIDRLAAVIILQRFLDETVNSRGQT